MQQLDNKKTERSVKMRNKLKKITHEDMRDLFEKILITITFGPVMITSVLLILLIFVETVKMIIQILF